MTIRGWLLQVLGEFCIAVGEHLIDWSDEPRTVRHQMRDLEQRHTALEAYDRGDEIEVVACGRVLRFTK